MIVDTKLANRPERNPSDDGLPVAFEVIPTSAAVGVGLSGGADVELDFRQPVLPAAD